MLHKLQRSGLGPFRYSASQSAANAVAVVLNVIQRGAQLINDFFVEVMRTLCKLSRKQRLRISFKCGLCDASYLVQVMRCGLTCVSNVVRAR
eukprot:1420309-Pyramimonas_sp.AAC.1